MIDQRSDIIVEDAEMVDMTVNIARSVNEELMRRVDECDLGYAKTRIV